LERRRENHVDELRFQTLSWTKLDNPGIWGITVSDSQDSAILHEQRPKTVARVFNQWLWSGSTAEGPEIEVRARFVKEAVYEKSKLAFPWNDTQPELVTSVGGEDLPIVVEACAQNMVIDSSSLWFWGDRFVNVIEAS